MLACASCLSVDEQWSFAVTGTVWPEVFSGEGLSFVDSETTPGEAEALAWIGAIIIVAPLAIDLVLLPITVPHDLIYVD
jgi:hypothetical protein